MEVNWTPEKLIDFENQIAEMFANKLVPFPVHLSGGNEEHLIRIFREHVNPEDWVLCSWRSHYACLLKGVPSEQVRQAILAGRSISLCFPEYHILSSGIVGGTAPIAVGLALGIKRKQEYPDGFCRNCGFPADKPEKCRCQKRKVVCFLGDMSAETGIAHESIKYAVGHDLPILFVIEDNGLSVSTETAKVWGDCPYPATSFQTLLEGWALSKVIRYQYKLTRPHVGIGKFVSF